MRLLALLLALALPLLGATFYIDAAAPDDTGDGSLGDPWQRIGSHYSSALRVSDDILILLPGTFTTTNQGGAANMKGWSPAAGIDNLTLQGQNEATVIIDYENMNLAGGENGFLLDAADGPLTIENITFKNVTTDGSRNHIILSDTDNVTIRNCTWDNVGAPACIRLFSSGVGLTCKDVLLSGLTFVNMTDTWTYRILANGPTSVSLDRLTIEDCVFNTIADIGDDTNGDASGITIQRMDSVIVRNCIGYNAGNTSGTDFIEITTNSDRVHVEDCTLIRYLKDNDETHALSNSDGLVIANGCDSVYVDRCMFWGAGHGIQAVTTSTLGNLWIDAVRCDSTYDDCTFVDPSVGGPVRITNLVSHYAQDNGIDVKGASVTIDHCTVVRAYNAPMLVWGTSDAVSVSNSIFAETRAVGGPLAQEGDVTEGSANNATWTNNLWWDDDAANRHWTVCDDVPSCANKTFAQWQALGKDVNGFFVRPRMKNYAGRAYPITSDAFMPFCGSEAIKNASDGTNIGASQAAFCPGAGRKSKSKDKGK